MLLLREKIVTSDSLLLLQRRDLSNEALKASQLLLTELATRIISGRQNSRAVSCARAARESSPALGWLPPY
ncbi:hypothetical protein M408DRAFT_327740 [Serendipita vermifera MAFF 305830]|uniref:Uncharacterized protein n=1 Tax=Serendipita vermifera MAFF 305830 TaxID=933852 RepID=A0A0C2WXA3_SERVB|nr:hypothetical protein M408DRAFT_327740 [Serendipita vermifera MAFF 305830]